MLRLGEFVETLNTSPGRIISKNANMGNIGFFETAKTQEPQIISSFEGQTFKTRPFPSKTMIFWIPALFFTYVLMHMRVNLSE